MIVLVEAVALECDPDFGEDLPHAGTTLTVFVLVNLRTGGEGVVGERLPEFEHLAGTFTPVVIGRHGCAGYRR